MGMTLSITVVFTGDRYDRGMQGERVLPPKLSSSHSPVVMDGLVVAAKFAAQVLNASWAVNAGHHLLKAAPALSCLLNPPELVPAESPYDHELTLLCPGAEALPPHDQMEITSCKLAQLVEMYALAVNGNLQLPEQLKRDALEVYQMLERAAQLLHDVPNRGDDIVLFVTE